MNENEMKVYYNDSLLYGELLLSDSSYMVGIENGRLNYEGNRVCYDCLVIRRKRDNFYVGSIELCVDKDGKYYLSVRSMFGNTTLYNVGLENYKDDIKYSIRYICRI